MGKFLLIYITSSLLVFTQNNLLYLYPNARGKEIYFICIASIPVSLCYFYSWNFLLERYQDPWVSKFVFLALSYITFPIYTYIFFDQNPITLKNIICIILSFIMLYIQLNFK